MADAQLLHARDEFQHVLLLPPVVRPPLLLLLRQDKPTRASGAASHVHSTAVPMGVASTHQFDSITPSVLQKQPAQSLTVNICRAALHKREHGERRVCIKVVKVHQEGGQPTEPSGLSCTSPCCANIALGSTAQATPQMSAPQVCLISGGTHDVQLGIAATECEGCWWRVCIASQAHSLQPRLTGLDEQVRW